MTSTDTAVDTTHNFPARRWLGALLAVQFSAMLGAFTVLAVSINWPASLDLPASEMLPLLLERFAAVFGGYTLYLTHAVLLIPIAILFPFALGLRGPMAGMIMAFGVLAGLAKALGIVRWLFMMPGLAQIYVDDATSAQTRAAIDVLFDAFNAYAGGVGELLGVAFFSGIWTVFLSLTLLRFGYRLLAAWGALGAVLLFITLFSVFGVDMPILLTVSGFLWQFWMLAMAALFWRLGREAV